MSKKHEELNKGAWTAQEDKLLVSHVNAAGEGKWNSVPKKAGLKRCGKSCRLRWKNYLRPNIKRGNFSEQEEDLIYRLHKLLGNRWSLIAGRLPGRTDNEIKNYWNTTLSKKMQSEKFAMEPPCNNTNAWKETQKSQYGSNNKEPLPPSCSKCKNDTSLIPTKSFHNPNNLPLQKSSYVTEKQQQYLQDVEEALMRSEEDMTTFDNDLLDFDGAVSFDGLNFESMKHRDDIGDDIVMLDADSETFDLW